MSTRNKPRGGRPSATKISYWLNQLPQFDPAHYQTEEEYTNVFKGAFPKTWGKVTHEIKRLVSDYYGCFSEGCTDNDKQRFHEKYGRVESVPFHEPERPRQNALKQAGEEILQSRGNVEPALQGSNAWAVAGLDVTEKEKAAQRKRSLEMDLGDNDQPDEKLAKKSRPMKQFQSEESKMMGGSGTAKDYPSEKDEQESKKSDDEVYYQEHQNAFNYIMYNKLVANQYMEALKNYNGGRYGPPTRDDWISANPGDKTFNYIDRVKALEKEFDKMVGEDGAFGKMTKLDETYGIQRKSGFEKIDQQLLADYVDALETSSNTKYNHQKTGALYPRMVGINQKDFIDRHGQEVYDQLQRLATAVNPNLSDSNADITQGGLQDQLSKMIEVRKRMKLNPLPGELGPGDAPNADKEKADAASMGTMPYTMDAEGKIVTEDPDKAYFNKKAKTVMTIAGHEFDDPINTIRPDYGLAGAESVVPNAKKQAKSDIIYDMFSVVPPGFGNGDTNKLFLQQQSWDKYVKFGGKLYGPNKFDGPTAGIRPMPYEWQNIKAQDFINRHTQSFNARYDTALRTAEMHARTEQPANALPSDYAARTPLSSKKLPRASLSALMPVIQNQATFKPAFDRPGFQRRDLFKRSYDPVRHPMAPSNDPNGIGQHLPYGLAFKEILQ